MLNSSYFTQNFTQNSVCLKYFSLRRPSSRISIRKERLLTKLRSIVVTSSVKWGSYGGCIPSILRALETIHNVDEALRQWETRLNNKERTIILKEQVDWRRAVEIFEWFKSRNFCEVNVIHYNIMLRLLGRARRWDLVEGLWIEMQMKKIKPTNSTYGTLIDTFSKGGRNKESLIWLAEMYKHGMEPDEVTMGIVVQAYKRAGEFQKAGDFFKIWSSSVGDASQTQKSYSLHTYNTLIDTFGKSGQLKEVSHTFAQMLKEGVVPDRVTFNTMIHVCGSHGRLHKVASLMAMMEELQCSPDTRTYNIIISLYAKNDNISEASHYFSEMKIAGLVPDIVSYRTLLYAFSIRSMVAEAEDLVSEMDDRSLDIDEYTQSALTRMYVHSRMLEKSWSWFEKFHHRMSSECYAANIDAFGDHGHLELAEKVFFCCLQRKKLCVLVLNVMIKAYGKVREYDKACEVFDRMEDNDVIPDKCSYSSLIQILTCAEMPYRAMSYVRKMQDAGLVSDCIPYSMVMTSLAKLGDLKVMEDLFKEMVSFGLQPDIIVFSILINAFAEIGNVEQAMNYFSLMRSAGFSVNSIICNSIIKVYTKVGYLQDAQEMYEVVKSLEGGPDVYSSNCMIDLYCENGMVKEAEAIFINLKSRKEANEFSYAMMLCLYKRMGRFYDACKICREMFFLGLITSTLSYNTVIGLYASHGRYTEVIETLYHMLQSGVTPNEATFRLLGEILLKRGVSKTAITQLPLTMKEDGQTCLNEWLKALLSISTLSYSSVKLCGRTKSYFQVDPVNMRMIEDEKSVLEEVNKCQITFL